MPPSASKGGVSEKLIKVCEECREEFCSGTCIIFQYDSYQVKVHTAHQTKFESYPMTDLCFFQRLIKENGEDDMDNPEEAAKKKKKRTKSAKKKKQRFFMSKIFPYFD